MNLNLLDKNRNFNILLAGILATIVGIGVARFAFTSLLPTMLGDFLSVTNAGLLASVNYIGYMAGAIFSVFLRDINIKVRFFQLGMILSIATTLILALTSNETLWFISRMIAGFGSAMVLIVGSSIVMLKLDYANKTKAMGIHFSGIGFAIVVSDLISQYTLLDGTWKEAWFTLSIIGTLMLLYTLHILRFDREMKKSATKHPVNLAMFTPYVLFLIAAYFTAGVGYVIQATFFPDIVNSLEGLEGSGSIAWFIVGVAGIFSSIFWMRLAHKYDTLTIMMITFVLQVIGILIPTLSNDLFLNLFSGVLYGSTFIGHVALFLHYGGKLAGKNPVIFMGAFTTCYGIGQIFAPLYSVALYEHYGNYDMTLYVTALIVSLGILFLWLAKKVGR
jgi:predicted MFS family arabinose efflux permease